MLRRTLRLLLLHAYSLAFTAAARALALAAPLLPKLQPQLAGRLSAAELAPKVAVERARFRHCAVFFCSSAGEFEQAKPLIDRLQALPSVYVQVIFFSQSGLDFARARGETLPFCLSPLSDAIGEWGWLFSALRPTLTCVVRHELWPGFLSAARRFGKVYLIDASWSETGAGSAQKRWLRSRLMHFFDLVFTVSEADVELFHQRLGVPRTRLVASGDTKYDRVVELAAGQTERTALLTAVLDPLRHSPEVKRLVLGSAYQEEVALWLAAQAERPAKAPPWQVVIAPHQLTEELFNWIETSCESQGLSCIRYSRAQAQTGSRAQLVEVIIVDCLGLLADLYAVSSAAFVGGALTAKVHNVLEPACRGLALAFGPHYKNSQEAIHLVNLGLAKVISEPAAFLAWWRAEDDVPFLGLGSGQGQNNRMGASQSRMTTAVATLVGASDRIMAAWRPQLGS